MISKLIRAEATMLWGELKQYGLNTLFYNIGMLVIFIGMFLSVEQSNSGMDMLFGLVMWQISSGAIGYLGYVIQDEAMLGTLEQIFMTRTSIFKVFISKIVVNFTFTSIKAYVLFLICFFVFGLQNEPNNMGFKSVLCIILIILFVEISFYMVGLMFGGMALFFKRVSNVVQLLTYILLFFTNITVPISETPKKIQILSSLVPIRWAMDVIRDVVNGTEIMTKDVVCLILNIVGYCVLGIVTFIFCINAAKKTGRLAGY